MEDGGRVGGAGEDGVDAGEGFGDSAFDDGGERERERERLRADGEEIGAFGDAVVELMTEKQKQGRRAGMGKHGMGCAGVGANGFAVDEAGREACGGVEENGEVAMAERFREFRCPLLDGVDEEFRAGELFAKRAGEMESDGVVATKGVATGEDEGVVHGSLIRDPCSVFRVPWRQGGVIGTYEIKRRFG